MARRLEEHYAAKPRLAPLLTAALSKACQVDCARTAPLGHRSVGGGGGGGEEAALPRRATHWVLLARAVIVGASAAEQLGNGSMAEAEANGSVAENPTGHSADDSDDEGGSGAGPRQGPISDHKGIAAQVTRTALVGQVRGPSAATRGRRRRWPPVGRRFVCRHVSSTIYQELGYIDQEPFV